MSNRTRRSLETELLSLRSQVAERTWRTWTPQEVEAETRAAYYEPILPAMAPWQYARLNAWLAESRLYHVTLRHRPQRAGQ